MQDFINQKELTAEISYDNITRIEHYPFPKDAVREAVFNALIHQDFSVGVPVQISVYRDKLYISNNCVFPANWTADTLMQKHRSLPHNPDIANTFFRAGFIESWNRGIEKICNLCKEYGIAEPEYTVHPNDIMMMFKANDTEVINEAGENESSKSGPKNKKWPEKWPEKADQIINAVSEDNKITIAKLEEILDIGHTTVKKNTFRNAGGRIYTPRRCGQRRTLGDCMKNEVQNLTENEYIELLNTAKAQINAARNALAVQVNSTQIQPTGILENYCMKKRMRAGMVEMLSTGYPLA